MQAKDYKTTYEQEVIRCFKSGEYCGLWQIHHVSSVIGRPIICLFPEIEDVEDEAPLCYFHNRTIYPREVARRSAEPITIMWSKASPVQEEVTHANHIVPVVRKYPVVHFLFKGEVEDGAPTEEHLFLYENFAEEEAQEVTNRKDSENGGFSRISDSSTITNGSEAVNDTNGKGRKKVTNRGSSCSTKIILPRPGKFIPTPGYSILSDTEKQKRNKELAEKNRLALQSLRKECKVVLTPMDDCSASQKEDSEGNSSENIIEKEIDYTSSKQEQEEVTVISSDKAMETGNDEEMLLDLEQEASDNMSQKKEDSRINAERENDEVSQKDAEMEVTQKKLQSMESNDMPEKQEENMLLT